MLEDTNSNDGPRQGLTTATNRRSASYAPGRHGRRSGVTGPQPVGHRRLDWRDGGHDSAIGSEGIGPRGDDAPWPSRSGTAIGGLRVAGGRLHPHGRDGLTGGRPCGSLSSGDAVDATPKASTSPGGSHARATPRPSRSRNPARPAGAPAGDERPPTPRLETAAPMGRCGLSHPMNSRRVGSPDSRNGTSPGSTPFHRSGNQARWLDSRSAVAWTGSWGGAGLARSRAASLRKPCRPA